MGHFWKMPLKNKISPLPWLHGCVEWGGVWWFFFFFSNQPAPNIVLFFWSRALPFRQMGGTKTFIDLFSCFHKKARHVHFGHFIIWRSFIFPGKGKPKTPGNSWEFLSRDYQPTTTEWLASKICGVLHSIPFGLLVHQSSARWQHFFATKIAGAWPCGVVPQKSKHGNQEDCHTALLKP